MPSPRYQTSPLPLPASTSTIAPRPWSLSAERRHADRVTPLSRVRIGMRSSVSARAFVSPGTGGKERSAVVEGEPLLGAAIGPHEPARLDARAELFGGGASAKRAAKID